MILENKNKDVLDKTIIIGCGSLGAAIALEKSKDGKNVVVLDNDPDSFLHLDKDYLGEHIIVDCSDAKKLIELGIGRANEVIVATGDDNLNIFLCHCLVKVCSPKSNIVVRIDDESKAPLLDGLKVKTIYPFRLSVDRYTRYLEREG